MMSPTAPLVNRQLVWHMYSAQAYGIFHGDLDFYFGGWDGRDRMHKIDTKMCPVYMLTGEYDWSNTPDMSQATADKIPGGKHTAMKGLGHFPATENPKVFVGYRKCSFIDIRRLHTLTIHSVGGYRPYSKGCARRSLDGVVVLLRVLMTFYD